MKILSSLTDFFYPRLCIYCKECLLQQEKHLCLHCFNQLPYTGNWKESDNRTEQIFWGRFDFLKAFSYLNFQKNGITQHIVHSIKYKNNQELGNYLGYRFGKQVTMDLEYKADYIIPVPLHKKKLRVRGYNQSEVIATGFAEALDIPILTDNLQRNEFQVSQTRKSRYSRYQNVTGVFELKDPEILNGKTILLLDDVVTTGATLEACAIEILSKSTAKIDLATLALAV